MVWLAAVSSPQQELVWALAVAGAQQELATCGAKVVTCAGAVLQQEAPVGTVVEAQQAELF